MLCCLDVAMFVYWRNLNHLSRVQPVKVIPADELLRRSRQNTERNSWTNLCRQ